MIQKATKMSTPIPKMKATSLWLSYYLKAAQKAEKDLLSVRGGPESPLSAAVYCFQKAGKGLSQILQVSSSPDMFSLFTSQKSSLSPPVECFNSKKIAI